MAYELSFLLRGRAAAHLPGGTQGRGDCFFLKLISTDGWDPKIIMQENGLSKMSNKTCLMIDY